MEVSAQEDGGRAQGLAAQEGESLGGREREKGTEFKQRPQGLGWRVSSCPHSHLLSCSHVYFLSAVLPLMLHLPSSTGSCTDGGCYPWECCLRPGTGPEELESALLLLPQFILT